MRFWKSSQLSSAFSKLFSSVFLLPVALLTLTSCNVTDTQIGDNFYPTIQISYTDSTVSTSSATVFSGSTVTLKLDLRDTNFNPFISTLLNVSFQAEGGTSTGTMGSATNNGDGTYSANFSGINAGTATTIHAFVNGNEIQSTLPTVTVTSGNYSLSNSVISLSSSSVTSGSSITVTLTVKDSSNNQSASGGLTVLFSNSGGSSTGNFGGSVTDHNDGTYSTTFTGLGVGTPTAIQASIQGSPVTSALPTVTVSAGIPILSFAGASGTTGTVGTAMSVTPTTLNNQGGAITGCAIKASTTALPAWATLNTTTCVITGTPTSTQSATSYTIDATNSAGTSSDATVSLSVGAGVPVLSYAGAAGTSGTVGTSMSVSPTTLNNQGGAITNCIIKVPTTALPAWATLNTSTCVITGTPTGTQSSTSYTINATNSAGTSTDATVSLSVSAGVPILSFAGASGTSGTVGTAMSVTPTTLNNQGGAITGCAIKSATTALPAWATLNTSTCAITGTPTGTLASTAYTIDATNSAGTSSDATVSLTVGAGVPILSYAGSAGTSGTVGTAISVTPTTLNNEGAAITGCAIKASTTALPAWATLNTTTCAITGTPTSTQSVTSYTIDATNSAGTSSDATVSLTVGAGVPILSFVGAAGTSGTVGTAMSVTPTTLNNQGSAITGCAIKASTTALPAWATLNATTCAITGTPTSTQSATSYTIDATNSAGTSSDATVSLTVGAGVPILSYSGAAGTAGTVGTALSVTPTTLNNQGAAITGCTIKASTTALPAWAILNTTTCAITGTPNGTLASTSYTIDATNSAGTSSDATVSLSVGAGVPVLSYAGASGTSGTVGTAMSVIPTTLNNQGAAITGCAIKASTTALPAWASLNTTTCAITGTPTGTLAATTYTIDATNSAGTSSDASVSLSVGAGVPVLSYSGATGTSGTVGTAFSVSPTTLNNQGAAITGCAIKASTTALPAWASLNTTTCAITGTPTGTLAATSYTIDATNSAGNSSDATVSLTIVAGVPVLSFAGSSGTSGTVGTAMSVTPTTLNNQGAAITGCAIKASTTALPAWATLNTSTCVITGTPTSTQSATSYTIDATNSAGTSSDATVSLTVGAGVPVLSFAGASGTSGSVGTAMSVTPTTLNNQGSAITGCAIKTSTTALPAWATLNTTTCVITGTPTSTQSATSYTIDATNPAGTSSDATVSLTVTAGVPILSYAGASGTSGTVGTAMSVSPTTLTTQGAAITGCVIKVPTTALPAWATLNTTTCVITGTPTGTQSATSYTIDATNSAGTSSDATVSLTVTAGVPILSYSGAAGTSGTVGTAMSVSPTTLNTQGGAITNCAIKVPTTALPAWATLNTSTCAITGTPTGTQSATSYTIDATNSAGVSSDATVSLTVTPGIPILSYASSTGTAGTAGTAMSVTPSTLNTQGGAITGCAIKASTTALPAWATLNTSTCVITGTPTGALSSTSYTIDATNSAGTSSDATVSLSVTYPVPTVTSISPTTGSPLGGTSVTLTGTGFYSGAAVLLGASSCTSIVVTSTTQITCTTPAQATGAVNVSVSNTGTTSGTLTNGYTYTTTSYAQQWATVSANSSSYALSSSTLDFSGSSNSCELAPASQVDNSNASAGFAGGTFSGVASYGTLTGEASSSGLKLGNNGGCNGSTANCANANAPELYELNSAWTPQWSSILGYWKMNNNWNDSKNSYNGTGSSGVTFTTSSQVGGYAGSFDGVSNEVTVADAAALDNLSGVSVFAWVKPTLSGSATQVVFDKWDGTTNNYGYTLRVTTTGALNVWLGNASGHNGGYTTSTGIITANQWQHIGLTYDGTTLTVFLNGKSVGTQSTSVGIGGTSSPLWFGGRSSGGSYFYAGAEDDVALWSKALTSTEVSTIYNRQSVAYSGVFTSRVMDALSSQSWTSLAWTPTLPFFKALPDYASGAIQNETSTSYSSLQGDTPAVSDNNLMTGIVGLWHLDEAAGTSGSGSVKDTANASGSTLNGTPNNVTFGANGKFNAAASFNGTSSYINFGNVANIGASDFTASAWFNSTSSGVNVIVSKSASTAQAGRWWTYMNAGLVNVYIDGVGNSGVSTTSTATYNDGKWHHMVAVFKRTGTLTLYMDGASVGTPVSISSFSASNLATTDYLYIGAYEDATGQAPQAGDYFSGSIDEVALWNKALNTTEVKQLYQRGSSRLKFQVRSCSDNTCTTGSPTWQGPDGTSATYFSELDNMSTQAATPSGTVNATLPSMTLNTYTSPVGTNRYFQYRTIFESDSSTTTLMPELKSVTVGPNHYDTSAPTVISKTGVSYYSLSSVVQTLGTNGCGSGVLYNLGVGASYSTATWYWWNGTAWASAGGTTATATTYANLTASSNAAITAFASTAGIGTGTVYFKAFLQSSGTSACELKNLELDVLQ